MFVLTIFKMGAMTPAAGLLDSTTFLARLARSYGWSTDGKGTKEDGPSD